MNAMTSWPQLNKQQVANQASYAGFATYRFADGQPAVSFKNADGQQTDWLADYSRDGMGGLALVASRLRVDAKHMREITGDRGLAGKKFLNEYALQTSLAKNFEHRVKTAQPWLARPSLVTECLEKLCSVGNRRKTPEGQLNFFRVEDVAAVLDQARAASLISLEIRQGVRAEANTSGDSEVAQFGGPAWSAFENVFLNRDEDGHYARKALVNVAQLSETTAQKPLYWFIRAVAWSQLGFEGFAIEAAQMSLSREKARADAFPSQIPCIPPAAVAGSHVDAVLRSLNYGSNGGESFVLNNLFSEGIKSGQEDICRWALAQNKSLLSDLFSDSNVYFRQAHLSGEHPFAQRLARALAPANDLGTYVNCRPMAAAASR